MLGAAIDASLPHLRRWLTWAADEPSPQADRWMRLSRYARNFDHETDWSFALMPHDESQVLGGAGLHNSADEDALEVGCWLRADMEGLGLALEATSALCHEAFFRRGKTVVELRCDPQNVRGVRLAERLGFARSTPGDAEAPGAADGPRDETVLFRLRRDEASADSPIRALAVEYDDVVSG